MKLYKKLLFGATALAAAASVSSCDEWLDVNQNPNTPSIEQAHYTNLMPWSQFYMNNIYGISSSNTAFYTGNYICSAANGRNAATWQLNTAMRAVNTQQWFLTQVANNYGPFYNKAMAAGAYHYAGVAKFTKAYGWIMLVDVFGEVPYTDACGQNPSPVYDKGEDIYQGCIKDIEEAIELFSKPQEKNAASLAAADYWNGGDTQKWIKLCYLLKARWLNHMSKKDAGKYTEGKYDADEILRCLDKAMASNADNTLVRHTDTNTPSHDVLGWNEPVDYNPLYSCVGMNSNYYVTKTYTDNLTNFDGKGIEDPRADKFIPWARSEKTATTPEGLKWTEDGKWRRSVGVDLSTNILSENGPFALAYNAAQSRWYCDDKSGKRLGDTIYVWMTCGGTGYYGGTNLFYRRNGKAGAERAQLSGVFAARPDVPSYVGTYSEACFIRAEVLMRKGDKPGAFEAYKKGVRASIDDVNAQLALWRAQVPADAEHPTFKEMSEEQINAFVNGALGSVADITMGKIMTQKLISMPFSNENWVDMRRHDYSKDVFMNYDEPYWHKNGVGNVWTYCPKDKQPRRWKQASFELNYNTKNLEAAGAFVPGAYDLTGGAPGWFNHEQVCTLPVWWDRK